MTRSLPPAGELPPGAWPWLHAVARWIGTWWYRPFFRVRVHHHSGGVGCIPPMDEAYQRARIHEQLTIEAGGNDRHGARCRI